MKLKNTIEKIQNKLQQFVDFIKISFVYFIINEKQKNNNSIYVFTPLPPEQTGTALYAYNIYKSELGSIKFVNNLTSYKNYECILNILPDNYQSSVIPIYLLKNKKNDINIYNLGNSLFHTPYLEHAIKCVDKKHSYITLCETQLYSLIESYCRKYHLNIKQMLFKYYPEKKQIIENLYQDNKIHYLSQYNIFCIRILVGLTGIKNFIVYREIGKDLLLKDIENTDELNVNVVSSPLNKIDNQNISAKLISDSKYLVGSFGIAHEVKQTDKIIEAINLLNNKGIDVKLLLAGYNVNDYCKNIDKTNLILKENPTYQDLLSYMKSVDLAVQLRGISNGEGSGCISELLSLNKTIIASEYLIDKQFEDYTTTVSPNCSVKELANIIDYHLKNNKENDFSELIHKHTFENTVKEILEIIR